MMYCVSSVVILSFSFSFFHSSFIQCYPLGSSYLVGKVLSIGTVYTRVLSDSM